MRITTHLYSSAGNDMQDATSVWDCIENSKCRCFDTHHMVPLGDLEETKAVKGYIYHGGGGRGQDIGSVKSTVYCL